jgi:hypothetical protein
MPIVPDAAVLASGANDQLTKAEGSGPTSVPPR